MIQLKDNTVNIHGISNELLFAMFVTDAVLNRYGSVLVITSINDGKIHPVVFIIQVMHLIFGHGTLLIRKKR